MVSGTPGNRGKGTDNDPVLDRQSTGAANADVPGRSGFIDRIKSLLTNRKGSDSTPDPRTAAAVRPEETSERPDHSNAMNFKLGGSHGMSKTLTLTDAQGSSTRVTIYKRLPNGFGISIPVKNGGKRTIEIEGDSANCDLKQTGIPLMVNFNGGYHVTATPYVGSTLREEHREDFESTAPQKPRAAEQAPASNVLESRNPNATIVQVKTADGQNREVTIWRRPSPDKAVTVSYIDAHGTNIDQHIQPGGTQAVDLSSAGIGIIVTNPNNIITVTAKPGTSFAHNGKSYGTNTAAARHETEDPNTLDRPVDKTLRNGESQKLSLNKQNLLVGFNFADGTPEHTFEVRFNPSSGNLDVHSMFPPEKPLLATVTPDQQPFTVGRDLLASTNMPNRTMISKYHFVLVNNGGGKVTIQALSPKNETHIKTVTKTTA